MIFVEEGKPTRFIECPNCGYSRVDCLPGAGRIPSVYWYHMIPINANNELMCPGCNEWIAGFTIKVKKMIFLVERTGFIFKKEERNLLKIVEVQHENR